MRNTKALHWSANLGSVWMMKTYPIVGGSCVSAMRLIVSLPSISEEAAEYDIDSHDELGDRLVCCFPSSSGFDQPESDIS